MKGSQDNMEEVKCPNCGKKLAYEETNNVVKHNDKEVPIIYPYYRTEAAGIVTRDYLITKKIGDFLK